jgi:hypothetical protein
VQLGLQISDGFALRDYNVLMLDLLQLSLKHLFNIYNQKLSLKTVLMLADQLDPTEWNIVHAKSFLHTGRLPQESWKTS